MKFAKNRLYIESYTKCPNCGVLIYEDAKQAALPTALVDGQLYCSAWCVDWQRDREARLGAVRTASRLDPSEPEVSP